MSKILSFLKEFWWVVLVPIAVLVFHLIFRKETPELDKLIKEKKKDIEKGKDKVHESSESAKEAEEGLSDAIKASRATSERVASDSEERDKKAEEFFK